MSSSEASGRPYKIFLFTVSAKSTVSCAQASAADKQSACRPLIAKEPLPQNIACDTSDAHAPRRIPGAPPQQLLSKSLAADRAHLSHPAVWLRSACRQCSGSAVRMVQPCRAVKRGSVGRSTQPCIAGERDSGCTPEHHTGGLVA